MGITTKTNKYIKIIKSRSLKSYYPQIYQPKMLKNIVKSKSFDSGNAYLSNIVYVSINWNARVYYNGKVFIKEDISAIGIYLMKTIVERYSKGKLKVTCILMMKFMIIKRINMLNKPLKKLLM